MIEQPSSSENTLKPALQNAGQGFAVNENRLLSDAQHKHVHSDIDLAAYQFWKLQSRLTKLNNQLLKEERASVA